MRGTLGSESSWISLRFLADSVRYEAMSPCSCSEEEGQIDVTGRREMRKTNRVDLLLLGRELLLEVLPHETDARRSIRAEDLDDSDRR